MTPATKPAMQSLGFLWDERTLTDTTFVERLHTLAHSEDIPFVDPLPALRAGRDGGLYFPIDGHWTPAGHTLVAALIAAELQPGGLP